MNRIFPHGCDNIVHFISQILMLEDLYIHRFDVCSKTGNVKEICPTFCKDSFAGENRLSKKKMVAL